MPTATEDSTGAPRLAQGRDPKWKPADSGKGSVGDRALTDGLIIVGIAWGIVFFLMLSLNAHNV